MRWLDLDLGRAGDVDRQVDEVVTTFHALRKNRASSSAAQVTKALALLKKAIVEREREMEKFYHENDLDPRSNRIETARLKLKRLMREVGFDASTIGGAAASGRDGPHQQQQETQRVTAGGGAAAVKEGPVDAASSSKHAAAALRAPTNGDAANPDDVIILKIKMTYDEYEQLRVRREATQQILRRGDGKLAWEAAGAGRSLASPRQQGMYTYGEIPFVPESNRLPDRHKPQLEGQPRFDTYGTPRASDPGRINDGQSHGYVSGNPELVRSTMRFATPRDATRGGARSVARKPFDPVTPRSKASSSLLKVYPLGTMK